MIVSLQLHIYISYNIVKQKMVKQLRNLVSLVEQAQGEPRATPAVKGPGQEYLSQQALPVSKRLGGVLNGSSAPWLWPRTLVSMTTQALRLLCTHLLTSPSTDSPLV